MELVNLSSLEATLAEISDPIERRRLRGRIRRLRRKEGVSIERITRSRTPASPYAAETPRESMERLRQELSPRFTECHRSVVGETWHAFPVQVDPDVTLAKYVHLYGAEPSEFMFLEQDVEAWLVLGPVKSA